MQVMKEHTNTYEYNTDIKTQVNKKMHRNGTQETRVNAKESWSAE